MLRKFLERLLHARLVATGDHDAAFQLITHHGTRDPAKVPEGALMARNPVGHLLGARGFGVGVVRRAEDRDEELDLGHLARGGINDRRLRARIVDEALLAGPVDLAHRQPAALAPATVELTELGVPIAVGVLLEVLQVQQFQGDAGLAAFGMEVRAVGDGPMVGGGRGRPVHPGLQDLVAEPLDVRPREAGGARPALDRRDGAQADPQRRRHLPVGAAEGPLLAEDLADLPHG